MSDVLLKTLSEWKLENVYEHLNSIGIADYETFLYLTESDVEKIFKDDFATKLKFQSKLKPLQRQNETCEIKNILARIEIQLQKFLHSTTTPVSKEFPLGAADFDL
ncbi:uncharacterized protein [Eurosta solidaginis]|uniref:uncharacterized protein isoform X2 n=1 Tax=Eurosta solidaginis TaxID=178769 RepID=UPI003530BC9D